MNDGQVIKGNSLVLSPISWVYQDCIYASIVITTLIKRDKCYNKKNKRKYPLLVANSKVAVESYLFENI